MKETLFDLNESLSPRLEWMKSRGVELKENAQLEVGAVANAMDTIWPWYAGHGGVWIGGATQDEALVNLCKYKGWRLWNEPSPTAMEGERKP